MEFNSLEELNKVLDYNFKNSLTLETLEVSCPECYKLYAINPHEIMTTKPQFSCRTCPTEFYFDYPECVNQTRIIGKKIIRKALIEDIEEPIQKEEKPEIIIEKPKVKAINPLALLEIPEKAKVAKPSSEAVKCPKCSFVNSISSIECIKCSVILAKALSAVTPQQIEVLKPSEAFSASDELKDLWELVLDNYEQEATHQNFVRYSHLENNLEYASRKYNSILSVNPSEEIANKMKLQIHTLAAVNIEKSAVVEPVKSIFRIFNIWTFSFILSFSIVALGLYFPQFKNLIGVGAFSLSLIVGLKILQSKYK